jgi:hypothetical protein
LVLTHLVWLQQRLDGVHETSRRACSLRRAASCSTASL